MLFQGQEFGENWGLPDTGLGRTLFERPLHWEYFYDGQGKALVRLYRILGALRRSSRALGALGSYYYYPQPEHLQSGVIAFRREAPATAMEPSEHFVVALNFRDAPADIWLTLPAAGLWREQIDGIASIKTDGQDQWVKLTVPSNYGVVYGLT